jgi:hypothetical protein
LENYAVIKIFEHIKVDNLYFIKLKVLHFIASEEKKGAIFKGSFRLLTKVRYWDPNLDKRAV